MADETYLYVLGTENGPVKVGISKNPIYRLSTLQGGNPYKLQIFYLREARDRDHAYYRERIFHEVFRDKRMAGEWFDLTAEEAAQGLDGGFDLEIWHEEEERQESISAALNIWCEPNGAYA